MTKETNTSPRRHQRKTDNLLIDTTNAISKRGRIVAGVCALTALTTITLLPYLYNNSQRFREYVDDFISPKISQYQDNYGHLFSKADITDLF